VTIGWLLGSAEQLGGSLRIMFNNKLLLMTMMIGPANTLYLFLVPC
jgi:hypothetical protein